jgi:hypothetical protein
VAGDVIAAAGRQQRRGERDGKRREGEACLAPTVVRCTGATLKP